MTALLCSFCGRAQREVKKLIAGPRVFICDECVGLCCDIIAEPALDADAHARMIALDDELRAARRRADDLEFSIRRIAEHVVAAVPSLRRTRCMWCEVELASDAEAREHVETCERHPAVIKLRELEASRP